MSLVLQLWFLRVLIIIGSGIWVCFWLVKTRAKYPFSFKAGFLLLLIAGMLVAAHEIIAHTKMLFNYFELSRELAMVIGFPGLMFLFVGIYIEAKDDPHNKKRVTSIFYTMIAGLTLCGLVILCL